MIDKIIEYSTRNRLAILILIIALILWGGYSLKKLPIDAVPDITSNQVTVMVNSPNLGPVEIERFLTTPIELIMSNIPGMTEIRSISRFGLSNVTIIFSDDIDLYWARAQVFERLKQVEDELPKGFGKPMLAPITTGLGEVFQYCLQTKDPKDTSFSLIEMRTIQDWVIRKKLLGTEGVADISSFGGFKKEYQTIVKLDRLKALQVTLDELFAALESSNGNTGGAYIEKDNRAYIIRGIGLVKSLEDIENSVIKINNNIPVLVKDVADIRIGGSIRYGAQTLNGEKEVVGAVVLMQKGENASKVVVRVKKRIAEIQKDLPQGLIIEPFIDREQLVTKTIHTVSKNLIEGAIIVILVLMLFLGDIRASLIAASLIPLSMLFAFGLMQYAGIPANLMSLGALDFGLIVDGSVIIVECVAIYISFNIRKFGKKLTYPQRQDIVISSLKDIKKSVVFGCLIILIVYFPILSLTGVEGKMFKPMAMTVIFAIIGALILSLTYVPMMCAWLMNKEHNSESFSEKLIHKLYQLYHPAFMFAMRQKAIIVGSIVILVGLSIFAFSQIGGEFMPSLDEGDFAIETRLPVGTSLTQTIAIAKKIQLDLLQTFPDEIEKVVSKIGTSEIPVDPMPLEAMDLIVRLKNKENWKKAKSREELSDLIAKVYQKYPGVEVSIQQPIEMRFNELISGAKNDVVIKLYGTELNKMGDLGKQIINIVRTVDGARDIQIQKLDGLPQINITYDRKNLSLYGITVAQVNDVLQTAFAGKATGTVYEDDRRYDLVVRLANEDRNNTENISSLLIKNYEGKMIPLKEIAMITSNIGPCEIRHYNKQRCVQIGFNVRGRDMESLVKEAQIHIKEKINLPYGYSIEYGGQFENLRRAKERLQIVLPLALIIIIGLLFATFGTFKDSLLIFTAVPLSATGGIFALFFMRITFSISAGIGFIALFGVAVLNGIMLVSHFKLLENNGLKDLNKIVMQGVKDKFRPVLMTSAVAALGFLPMAISTSAGAEVQKPLATVVIGGLIISTMLTLLVLPILYILFTKPKRKKKNDNFPYPIIPLILFFSAIGINANAQTYQNITLQNALKTAINNHPLSKISDLRIQKEKALKPASFNIGSPELVFEAPTSSEFRPGVMMQFDFPTVYGYQYKSQNLRVQRSEAEKLMNLNYLIYKVSSVYNSLQFYIDKNIILHRQDSTYSAIMEINEVRYRVGQISNLERVNGEAKFKAIHNQFIQNQAIIKALQSEFNIYLSSGKDTVYIPQNQFSPIEVKPDTLISINGYSTNPSMMFYQKNENLSKSELATERWRLMPGFFAGYLNQGDRNSEQLYRLRYGITVPIFLWNNNARIRASKAEVAISQNNSQLNEFNLRTDYSQAVSEYNQYNEVLKYYNETGLLQSAEVLKSAVESYRAGSISYYAYLQNIEQAYSIELNYIEAIKNFNQSVINIKYISGK